MVKIYMLQDPRNLAVRYIGATTQSLSRRLTGHIYDGKKRTSSHKAKWIKSLLKQGLSPVIQLIEECVNWQERERFWCEHYRLITPLVNSTKGGEGIVKKSDDSIRRTGEAKFKPIVQYDLQGRFIKDWVCIRDATAFYKLSRNSIKGCLAGRSASSGGFKWKYRDKETVTLRTPRPKIPVSIKKPDGEIVTYKSVQFCAKHYKISHKKLYPLVRQTNILNEDIVQALMKIKD
jgi:hypothetical protein